MNTFNKYQFLVDLKIDIISGIKSGNIHDIQEYIINEIDNACIYYSNCFDICKELNATDFNAYDFECDTIMDLAYACLYQFVFSELDTNELEEFLNECENA